MEPLYRLSYYAGVQTLRLIHRLGRFLTLIFLPLRLLMQRSAALLRRHRGRTLRAKLRTFMGYVAEAGGRVKAAWKRKPILGVLQVLWLPIAAVRRYRRLVKGVATLALIALSLNLLLYTFRYWNDITFALALTDTSGETWGYVTDEAELQAGIAMAQERIETTNAIIDSAVTPDVTLHMIPQADLLDRTGVCDYLLSKTSIPLKNACGVYVDNLFCGAVLGRNTAQRLLNDILEESCEGQTGVTASFLEKVELIEGKYPQERIITAVDMKEQLVSEDADSQLQVLVSGTMEYEIEIPFAVKRVADASQYEGHERIRVNGESGRNLVTATVTYLNGKQLSSVITSSKVLKEPVTQVVAYGTKKVDKNYKGGAYATGRFIWPVPSTRYVTQYFKGSGGERHGGLDIWRRDMTGDDIVAADGGTVILAMDPKGTSYWSYGKYIIIDHGGGYQSVYAHCDELLVKEGDKVLQGQRIALVGNTGRSTAPHLHFEIRVNGRAVDPMKFY